MKTNPIKFKSVTPVWIIPPHFLPLKTEEFMGFVYKITNTRTGMFYIGQKKFWVGPKPPCKYKNKKVKESDWKTYWSSCNELKKDLIKEGSKWFRREIIGIYKTKWDMSYNELVMQLQFQVLEKHTNTYNSYVGCRLRKRK